MTTLITMLLCSIIIVVGIYSFKQWYIRKYSAEFAGGEKNFWKIVRSKFKLKQIKKHTPKTTNDSPDNDAPEIVVEEKPKKKRKPKEVENSGKTDENVEKNQKISEKSEKLAEKPAKNTNTTNTKPVKTPAKKSPAKTATKTVEKKTTAKNNKK